MTASTADYYGILGLTSDAANSPVDLACGRRRSVASPPPFRVSAALADHHDPVMTNHLPGGKPESAAKTRPARVRRST